MDRKDQKVLLISEFGLVEKQFDKEYRKVTWERCSLRTWLNKEFYQDSFSIEEKKKIVLTNIIPYANPMFSTNPGNATQDNIFLLSIREVENYFNSESSRKCFKNDQQVNCVWWLRSPGNVSDRAAVVWSHGVIGSIGYPVNKGSVAVRPALWINLPS